MQRHPIFNVGQLACSAGLILAVGAFSACGETEPAEDCATGEFCECTVDTDCPDPTLESCTALVPGQPGFCVAGGTGTDVGDDADATDTGETDTGETDTGETDAGEDVEDTAGDVADVEDTSDTGDVEDASDTSDATDTEDASDVEDTTDADASDVDDASDTTDTDAGTVVHEDPYLGWIAYHVVGTASPVERIHLVSADGTLGPYTMPFAWEFGGTKYATFSPDGTRLAYSLATETGPAIRIVTLADATFEDILNTGEYASLRFPRWSPDGSEMLFLAKTLEDTRVWNIALLDVESGDSTVLTDQTDEDVSTSFVSAGAWNGDASRVLYITGVPGQGQPSDIWSMNPDGTDAEAITVGANPTSLILSVRPDGSEALFDSAVLGQPARVGILDPAPAGGLAYGMVETVGIAGADSSCAYYGNAPEAVCTRLQTSEFETCFSGGADCTQDIVVIDLVTGDTVRNISRSIDARDGFAAVSLQPYTDITVFTDD